MKCEMARRKSFAFEKLLAGPRTLPGPEIVIRNNRKKSAFSTVCHHFFRSYHGYPHKNQATSKLLESMRHDSCKSTVTLDEVWFYLSPNHESFSIIPEDTAPQRKSHLPT
jgi:hypothetical protein